MLDILISKLIYLSENTPLLTFIILGTTFEEVIAPIPSPLVLTLGGAVAKKASASYSYLIFLTIIASATKTSIACLYYLLASKIEDRLPKRIFRMLGTSKEKIEELGKKFSEGRRDDITIFILRALPLSPSATISLAAGFLKTDFQTFVRFTFLGYLIPISLYLFSGFAGFKMITNFVGTF